MKISVVSTVSMLVGAAFAARPQPPTPVPPIPPREESFGKLTTSAARANVTGTAFFDQLIDHNDSSKGTFKQQFSWDASKWAGPGSPVVLFTPGDVDISEYHGYLRNYTITGLFAQEIKGATILLENRYYGKSSPYDTLTVENLQFMTLKQSVADTVYFARNVDLPFDTDSSSNAPQAPWVFSGGSYSATLSAYTESVAPGTFWAYHASSAPIEAIENYWEYFVPIQEGMPKNCSTDITLVIDYIDTVLEEGSDAEKLALKTKFGLQALEHDDDFASALRTGPWNWQDMSVYDGYPAFYQFCDTVEGVTAGGPVPDAGGVGLDKALAGYAAWIDDNIGSNPDACTYYGYAEYDISCYNSYDPNNKLYTNLTVENPAGRQYQYILCHEPLNFWQDGAPRSRPTLVSRLVTAAYSERICGLYFPNAHADNTVHEVNKWSKGWRLENTTRLTWTNGQFDPWIEGSVSSEFRPGGPLASTVQHPVNVIPGGVHCYDLILQSGVDNAGVQAVIDIETKQIVDWVAEFYAQ